MACVCARRDHDGCLWTDVYVQGMVLMQTIEIAEALGAPRGPEGFGEAWTPLPVVLIVNKADLLAEKPKDVRSYLHLGRFMHSVRHTMGHRFPWLTPSVPWPAVLCVLPALTCPDPHACNSLISLPKLMTWPGDNPLCTLQHIGTLHSKVRMPQKRHSHAFCTCSSWRLCSGSGTHASSGKSFS